MRKVLIANRGEIAVRIARAYWDAGLESVAVWADPDRDAVHVRACDEAYALLGGSTHCRLLPGRRQTARCLPPEQRRRGFTQAAGFLSENADFAQSID